MSVPINNRSPAHQLELYIPAGRLLVRLGLDCLLMLNGSRGCRVRTTVVIDEISVGSAFSEGVCRDGGGVLSSASRVVVAGRSLWARGSEAKGDGAPRDCSLRAARRVESVN